MDAQGALATILLACEGHPDEAVRARLGERVDEWLASIRPDYSDDDVRGVLEAQTGTALEPFVLDEQGSALAAITVRAAFSRAHRQSRVRIVSTETLGAHGGLVLTNHLRGYYVERFALAHLHRTTWRHWFVAPAARPGASAAHPSAAGSAARPGASAAHASAAGSRAAHSGASAAHPSAAGSRAACSGASAAHASAAGSAARTAASAAGPPTARRGSSPTSPALQSRLPGTPASGDRPVPSPLERRLPGLIPSRSLSVTCSLTDAGWQIALPASATPDTGSLAGTAGNTRAGASLATLGLRLAHRDGRTVLEPTGPEAIVRLGALALSRPWLLLRERGDADPSGLAPLTHYYIRLLPLESERTRLPLAVARVAAPSGWLRVSAGAAPALSFDEQLAVARHYPVPGSWITGQFLEALSVTPVMRPQASGLRPEACL